MTANLTHTVQQGETLSKIADHYEVSVDALVEWNHIENQHLIYAGDLLVVMPIEEETADLEEYELDESALADASDNFTEAELTLLAQLVYNEANVEPYEGKVAVVHVVLNRIASEQFPDTVFDVVYQKNQFSGSENLVSKPVTDDNMKAVKEALNTPDSTEGALYFWDPSLSSDTYMRTLDVVKIIGGHEFLV